MFSDDWGSDEWWNKMYEGLPWETTEAPNSERGESWWDEQLQKLTQFLYANDAGEEPGQAESSPFTTESSDLKEAGGLLRTACCCAALVLLAATVGWRLIRKLR